MPRKSQRKGRRGELEVAALFRAAGFDAAVLGIYEALDVRVAVDGHDRKIECKRKKRCLGEVYKAIEAGAWGVVERADNQQWLLVIPLRTFFDLAGTKNDKPSVHEAMGIGLCGGHPTPERQGDRSIHSPPDGNVEQRGETPK